MKINEKACVYFCGLQNRTIRSRISCAMDRARSASSQGGKRMSGVAPQPMPADSQKVIEGIERQNTVQRQSHRPRKACCAVLRCCIVLHSECGALPTNSLKTCHLKKLEFTHFFHPCLATTPGFI